MEEIFEELEALQKKLKSFGDDAHWFCPKQNDDDDIDYDNPDSDDEEASISDKHKLISDAGQRQKAAYQFCLVFALAADDVGEWQQTHISRLTRLLTQCDRCVKNYHIGRKQFLKDLSERFEEDIVVGLEDRINDMDFARIDKGLLKASSLLERVQEDRRGMKCLKEDPTTIVALYEALCCAPYHTSDAKLALSFDFVFKSIQLLKPLKLGDLLPAMTQFLFTSDLYRLRFATNAWEMNSQPLTSHIYEWVVEDSLIGTIKSFTMQHAPPMEVRRFWQGLLLILDKLDKPLITHSLRGMEVQPDVYHLALQHLSQYDSDDILGLIITAIGILLNKSPQDFWDACGSISPATFAEQILTNRAFHRLVVRPEMVDKTHTPVAVAWIFTFMRSLPPAQQYEPCRLILYNLFESIQQAEDIPQQTRFACFRAGLDAMLQTLVTFTDGGFKIDASTSFIVISNSLGLVGKYKDTIVGCANITSKNHEQVATLAMSVIRNALALHCKFLQAEYRALAKQQPVHHGMNNEALPIWQTILDSLNRQRSEMARNMLIGITPLIGLERFKPMPIKDRDGRVITEPLSKRKVNFNDDFGQVTEMISRILERLCDFDPNDVSKLFEHQNTAYPLFGALMPPEQEMYEAAVELFKIINGQSGRKEAISATLSAHLGLGMESLAYAAKRISTYETFAALPYFIKTSRDVLNSLCDSQDGILRTRLLLSTYEQKSILIWWESQWYEINTAFASTEKWSVVNDKDKMTDFCRDAIEYAENLFDQYSVLATVLGAQNSEKNGSSKISQKDLLEQPRRAMDGMSKWLRLKDPYLLTTVVSLVSKILRRLGEFNIEVGPATLHAIENVARDITRTNLASQQKSQLSRALEEHQGIQIVEKPNAPVAKRQSTIEAWSKSVSAESSASEDYHSLTKTVTEKKSALEMMRARQLAKPAAPVLTKKALEISLSIKESRQKAKEDKARRDAETIAAARALRKPGIVQGESLGVKGISGKDHTLIRGEIMVSSEEEESSEDDGNLKALILKGREGSKSVREYEANRRDQLIQLQRRGPVRKTKIARSEKDMRARLKPSMDPLHSVILDWDIFHEGEDSPQGGTCQKVSNKFRSPDEYMETFFPLLISEAWRSFSTAKEESNFKPFYIKIVNRLSVDRFMEVSTTMPIAENRENNIMEGDIVLFSKGQDPLKDRQEKHCLARVHLIKRKKDVLEISYRIKGHGIDPGLLSALAPNLKIRGLKITSMTTIEREYAALGSLKYYDLCEEILSAEPSPILPYSDESVRSIKQIYGLNTGQAKAIRSAKDNDAFTLIQGPPGSGKTKTIIAMVGALLTKNFTAPAGVAINHPGNGPSNIPSLRLSKKLLVCAPSNAAVDELVVRLKAGVKTLNGEFHKINVIRLGRSDAINSNVKNVTLDELVKAKIEGDGKGGTLVVSEREKLHQHAARLKEELATLRPKLEEARTNSDKDLERRLQKDVDLKRREQTRVGAKIDENKDSGNTAARENEILRRKLQQQIIDSAHVLCATLSGSGHDMFANLNVEFDTVIIDEAAQSIELSALIPLKYGCSKCVLVGDPKQLPPTVLSRSAATYGYEQSLFVRMQQNHPKDVHLLDTQYRMHPEISLFPSTQFYDGKLVNGDNMASLRHQTWHDSEFLGPYRFFDVKGTQTSGVRGHSFINIEEISVAMQLYHRLRTDYRNYDFRGKVGIITPYKAQLRELRSRFQNKYGEDILEHIDFNTTDAFQGREAEVIIFSCVRARATGGIGFLQDIRRMNVGLTRAKSSLWVLGDSQSLYQGEFWAKLIDDAKSRKRYTAGNILDLLNKSTNLEQNSALAGGQQQRSTTVSNNPMSFDTSSAQNNRRPSITGPTRRTSIPEVEMTDAPDIPLVEIHPLSVIDKKFPLLNKKIPAALRDQKSISMQHNLNLSSVGDKKVKHDEREVLSTVGDVVRKIENSEPPILSDGLQRRPISHGVIRKRPAADPLIRREKPKRSTK